MLLKQDLINKVKDYFELNIYETKVWLALLKKGVASAGEVASISGVPRSRTYDVLESLEKRGFAIEKLEKPAKYIGVKPRTILEKIKNDVKNDAEKKISELSKIKESEEYSLLESLYDSGGDDVKRDDVSVALRGKANISGYIKHILRNSKKEVIICTSVDELLFKERLFKRTFDILKKTDVKLKVALSGDNERIKQASEKFGVKFTKINFDAKFFISDRKEIIFYMSKGANENDMAIWLNSEFFSEAFAALFEKAMKK